MIRKDLTPGYDFGWFDWMLPDEAILKHDPQAA